MTIRMIRGNANDGGFMVNDIHITKNELKSLYLLASGYDNESGAKKMHIGVPTFRNNVGNTMRKLGAKTRTHAVTKAVQNGMLEIEKNTPDDYYLCMKCGKVFNWDRVKEKKHKPITVNHVKMSQVDLLCPNKGCNGDAHFAVKWEHVHRKHPEYPEMPKLDKVYQFDFNRWHLGL
ncbi:response regulator transcription factor [Chloroflexota bacterium]